ncbi:hypothetical protein J8F10_32890 [Gemmata sp. G18]|uniref:Uncharacterized protein n=1 Tax=Gemmata palustris TaxID=2822762 RepID=A0ABS5C3I9_9BACT|nr:hypothetical protein [Gemmata palustris]MBP3960050.1 hypothetical protein [Gemmata palustris]
MSAAEDDSLTAFQGDQAFGSEDRAYEGSTFREVRDAVFAEPRYFEVWPGPGKALLPNYPLTLGTLIRRFLNSKKYPFFQAAQRTVDSKADLRWGPDRKGVRRILHPNGVCLTGTWEITEPNDHTGYFRQGSKGLVIARYSVGGGIRRGEPRSLAMVGKLYPTADPNSPDRVRPAAFITQEDFGGTGVSHINDAELRNAPDTHAWRRGIVVLAMLSVTGLVFSRADTHPTFRQLYEIAELGKPPSEPTRAPEFLRFLVHEDQPRIPGDGLDFRDEILAQIYDGGDPVPKRQLVFHIEVSDTGYTRGPAFYQRRTISNWKRIGRLVFTEAVTSYNGDFVVHFHHPGWRTDRNDPATALRQGGRRVR